MNWEEPEERLSRKTNNVGVNREDHVTVKNREKIKEESRLGGKPDLVCWCVAQNWPQSTAGRALRWYWVLPNCVNHNKPFAQFSPEGQLYGPCTVVLVLPNSLVQNPQSQVNETKCKMQWKTLFILICWVLDEVKLKTL